MISRLQTLDHWANSGDVRIPSGIPRTPNHHPQVDFGSGVHSIGIRRQEFPGEKILKPLAREDIRRVG